MAAIKIDPTITGDILEVYKSYLANFQVDVLEIFRRSGFDRTPVADIGRQLPLNAISELLELSANAASEPNLALRFVNDSAPGYLGLLDHLLLSAPTIGHACESIEQFTELAVSPSVARLRVSGQSAVLTVQLPRLLSAPSQQFIDIFAGTLVRRLRPVDGGTWYPEHVNLPRYQPSDVTMYHEVFGPRVSFEAHEFRLVLARGDLDLPKEQVCSGLHDTVRLAATNLAAKRNRQLNFVDVVTDVIQARLIANRQSNLTAVAREQNISTRTLQWKLASFGISFEEVLNGVRIELATSMLRDTSLPLGEIGLRIGLSEGSAFTRWSKRQFAMAPGAYRKRLRGQI